MNALKKHLPHKKQNEIRNMRSGSICQLHKKCVVCRNYLEGKCVRTQLLSQTHDSLNADP